MKIFEGMTCYCCDNPAVSGEHAPAQAFFPKKKYLPKGYSDLRKNLIQVPSCDVHNSAKCNEDEFIACIMAMFTDSSQAADFFSKKWIKAIKRSNGALLSRLIQFGQNPRAFSFPSDDFNNYFIMMTRALYFHDTNEKLNISDRRLDWSVYPLMVKNAELNERAFAPYVKEMARVFDSHKFKEGLLKWKQRGENIGAFWYQYVHSEDLIIYRFMFYDTNEIFVSCRIDNKER